MPTLLHIQSSPNVMGSKTRELSKKFVSTWVETHENVEVEVLDLVLDPLPHFGPDALAGIFAPPDVPRSPEMEAAAATSDRLIRQLEAADVLVIGSALINMTITTQLKSWFDYVSVAGRTFEYSAPGVARGLLFGKKVFVIEARGGDYNDPPMNAFDFQEPLLRMLLMFIGLFDVSFIRAEGHAMFPERNPPFSPAPKPSSPVWPPDRSPNREATRSRRFAVVAYVQDRMTENVGTGFQTLSERITPHLAEIAARAQETEDARCVPAENIELIRNAGFVRAFVPKQFGGDERDLWDYVEGVRTVTKACPSTGWVTGVGNVHQVVVPNFRKEVRDAIWADGPDAWIVSSGTAVIEPELVEGGVLVTGRGRWSSGCDHAEWAMIGLKMPDLGDPNYLGRSHRDTMFMAHRSEFTIDDTWHSKAVAGSGSNDLLFDKLFVSNERLETLDAINFGYASGAGSADNWHQYVPMAAFFSSFLPAIALGCADGMVEEFIKRQKVRKNAYTKAAGIKNPAGHMRLAESIHEIESLTVYYKHLMDQMQEYGENHERLTEDKFHNLVQRMPFITNRALEVVERLFVGAGSSAVASFNPMQRYWRDAHAARMHTGSDYDTALQWHGRNILGMMGTPDL